MWMNSEPSKTGQRIHALLGAALTADAAGEPFDVIARTAESFRVNPIGAGASPALRFRCSSAVSTYLLRCRPVDWSLIGLEVTVGSAVADLIWEHASGRVVIDEVKSGAPSPTGTATAEQVCRLAWGGAERFGERFAGVRLVPIASPSTMSFHQLTDGRLIDVALPAGMGLRS